VLFELSIFDSFVHFEMLQGLASTEIVPASVTAVTPVSMLLLSRDVLHTHMGSAAELNSRASVEKYSVIAQVKAATAVSAVPAVIEHSVDEPRKIQSWDRRKDFTVIGALGQGSFATVLLVRSRVTGETFALKTLQRHKIEVPAQQAHVLNERRVLAALDSPFLVRLYGTTKDEHCLGFVLEPCLAGEMSHFLQQRVRLPEASARFYLGCVVLGLEAMHSKNVYEK
jgi:hypothetical protein